MYLGSFSISLGLIHACIKDKIGVEIVVYNTAYPT